MSQENVEFVRNFYAVHNRGGAEFWDLLPPDFVFDFSRLVTGPGIQSCQQTRADYDRMRHAVYEEGRFRLEPNELIDAGDNVLVLIRSSGRAKSGAGEVSGHIWGVWTFRDGKPVRWTDFGFDRSEAFEAVGLELSGGATTTEPGAAAPDAGQSTTPQSGS
jgi:ketosteroid isomerase-like protein